VTTIEKRGTKASILAAAQSCFLAGGGDFEMSEVARTANVSVGLAYHYFGSKAGLVSTIISDFYDRYDAVINHRFEKGMPWSTREYLRLVRLVTFLFSDPLAELMLGRLGGNADVLAVETKRRAASIALGTLNIRKGQQRGEIDPAIDAAIASAAIAGGVRQAVWMALQQEPRMDVLAFSEQAWGFIAGSLALPRQPPVSIAEPVAIR
jgi:AcrR family transcriptional regulator